MSVRCQFRKSALLLNHLVGAGKHRRRNCEASRIAFCYHPGMTPHDEARFAQLITDKR
jgi:hypothetical protein